MSGNSARFWKISAVGRSRGAIPAIERPPIRTSPALGSTNPETAFRIVVLPQPEGPSSEKNSPAATSRSVGCTAVAPPG